MKIKPILFYFFTLLFVVNTSISNAQADIISLSNTQYIEQPVYEPHYIAGNAVLKMGYGSYKIKNPYIWGMNYLVDKILEVDVVFTKYPIQKKKWLQNYDSLLSNRIKEIKELIPSLKEDSEVKWNIIAQTNCHNASEAVQMFHGAVIKYKVKVPKNIERNIKEVKNIITGSNRISLKDSVVFKVLNRNPDWEKVLVINDWTGSMYAYGAQAVLWHRLNLQRQSNSIKYFIFFNDGNLKESNEKEINATGGIYPVKADSLAEIIQVMREVMINGDGGDYPENDVEAILYGLKQLQDYKEVVLIADNKSSVRDISLINRIKKPIKVILCGIEYGTEVHEDYLLLAQRTNGSIHTVQEDITDMALKEDGETIEILGVKYQLTNGKFESLGE